MCRGNNGQETFINDDGRRLFLSTLEEACGQTGWFIHAYVLMSNHYHLLLETPEANLVAGMRWFQGAYTQRFNAMFKRRGHLFQGRYKAVPVQTDPRDGGLEYFRQVSTYIHLNPFRASLCVEGLGTPLEDYRWSSYPAYVGKSRKRPESLVREKVLNSWGLEEGKPGTLAAYRGNIERVMNFENDPDAGRRGEFEKQIKRGWFIGSEEFKERLDERLRGRSRNDNYRGLQRREHDVWEAERLLEKGLKELDLTEEEILESRSVRLEKQALAWLLKSHTAVTGKWLAARLRMGHPMNASRAIGRFRKAEGREVKQIKERMLKCVG
jgi:REP element-mobilizing transposase RayT